MRARDAAADLLLAHDRQGAWPTAGIEALRARLDDPRERGLLTELAFGTLRMRGALDAVLAPVSSRGIKDLNGAVRTALRLAAYQALYLDRVPAHAAVDHAVGWARRHAGPRRAGFVNGVLRGLLRAVEGPAGGAVQPRRDLPREDGSAVRFRRRVFPDPAGDRAGNLARRYAMPTWLVVRWLARWGDERTEAVLRAGITRPPVTLRARADRDVLAARLRELDVAFEAGRVEGAFLLARGEGAALTVVAEGLARVQDAASQAVVPCLALAPGQNVLDLCAAPGGKTLHIADRLGRGEVVAADVDAEKVAALDALAAEMPAGVRYAAREVPAEGPLPFEAASFDRVLVDAPCTNTGVLRRRVEARWRLRPADIAAIARIQVDLLARAAPLVKAGGRLVYSTCSVEPEENADVVAAFLRAHAGWTADEPLALMPRRDADGGYVVALEPPREPDA